MSRYTFILQDLVTGNLKDEVPLRAVSFGKVRNAPGFLNASIDYRHPKATPTNFARCRTAIYVMRDGVCVWGGILWTLRRNGDGLNVGAEGFWSYFRRRRLRETKDYTTVPTDPLAIVRDLIDYAQDATKSPGGDIGVTTGSELWGTTVARTWYGYERKVIAEIIEALSDNNASFDFEIDPVYDADTNNFDKILRLYAPRQGRRTSIAWEVGIHCELNEYFMDGTRQENQVLGIGAGEGDAMKLAQASDTNQLGAFPLLEGAFIAKDISDPTHLRELCEARLAARRMPGATPSIVLKPDAPEAELGTYIIGDEIKLVGGDGFSQFNQYFRIDSYTVKLSEEGKEDITVEFEDRSLVEDEEAAS